MTNNPTIDGVSLLPCPFCGHPGRSDSGFGLCESINYAWCTNQDCFLSDGVDMGITLENWNSRRAPAVERQDPISVLSRDIQILERLNESINDRQKRIDALNTDPEVAALQSTIAQLKAENSRVNDAWHDMKRELDLAKARIGELESGRGEPVAVVTSVVSRKNGYSE